MARRTGHYWVWMGGNCTVTTGKVYEDYDNGFIKLDDGRLVSRFNCDEWKKCDKKGIILKTTNTHDQCHNHKIENNINQEEITMLTIKDVTLINGENSKKFSIETLIGLIKEEEDNLKNLREIKTSSKAVKNRISAHEDNIQRLVGILDAKES